MVTGDLRPQPQSSLAPLDYRVQYYRPANFQTAFKPEGFSVFSFVLPEGKFDLVTAFSEARHAVRMCGDRADQAPALRQARVGVTIKTTTSVADRAAGVALFWAEHQQRGGRSIEEGELTFRHIRTYTLNGRRRGASFSRSLLACRLVMTGRAVTPMLIVIVVTTGDFLAMRSPLTECGHQRCRTPGRSAESRVRESCLDFCFLAFSTAILPWATPVASRHRGTSTLTVVSIVFGSQVTTYVIRGRQNLWGLRPSIWLVPPQ